MGDLLSYSFDGYLAVSAWNANLNEEKQEKILQITAVAQGVTSMKLFQKLMVYLAERPTPGRIVTIYWVAEGCKLQLLEKLTGISYKDYQEWSFLRKMLTRQGRQCNAVMKQIDQIKIVAVEYAYMKLKAMSQEGTSV